MTQQWQLSGNAENVDWKDIAETGRAYADKLVGEPAVSKVMHMMADEIELLRGYRDAAESDAAIAHLLVDKLRLTDDERAAIGVAVQCVGAAMTQKHPEEEDAIALLHKTLCTLRKLLERPL